METQYQCLTSDTSRIIKELINEDKDKQYVLYPVSYLVSTKQHDSKYIIPKVNVHSVDFSSGKRVENTIKINDHYGWILSTNKNGVPYAQAESENTMQGESRYIDFNVPKEFKGYIEIVIQISPGISEATHADLKDIVLVTPGIVYPERFKRGKDIFDGKMIQYNLTFVPGADNFNNIIFINNYNYDDPLYKGNIVEKILPTDLVKPYIDFSIGIDGLSNDITTYVELRSKNTQTGELNSVTFVNGSTKLIKSNDQKEEDVILKIPQNFKGWIELTPVVEGSSRKLDKLVLKTSEDIVYKGE